MKGRASFFKRNFPRLRHSMISYSTNHYSEVDQVSELEYPTILVLADNPGFFFSLTIVQLSLWWITFRSIVCLSNHFWPINYTVQWTFVRRTWNHFYWLVSCPGLYTACWSLVYLGFVNFLWQLNCKCLWAGTTAAIQPRQVVQLSTENWNQVSIKPNERVFDMQCNKPRSVAQLRALVRRSPNLEGWRTEWNQFFPRLSPPCSYHQKLSIQRKPETFPARFLVISACWRAP